MALAAQTLIERALRLVDPEPARQREVQLRTAANVLIPVALARVVSRALEADSDAFKRTFTVTATDGAASASAMIAAGVVPDSIRRAEVYHASSPYRFEWQPDRTGVELMAERNYPVVALEGTTLYFGDAAGETGTLDGTVTVVAAATPTITNGSIDIPARYEAALAEELAALLKENVRAEAA